MDILKFNLKNNIYFFRITSDLIPFASHQIMKYKWQERFKSDLNKIGNFIKKNHIRISMHPGQYTVLNSNKEKVYSATVKELKYHVEVLDLMNLDETAKVQIHGGGVYGNKQRSMKRFIDHYEELDKQIKKRLVIENDEKSYALMDCLEIHENIKIPIILDVYHHQCYNNSESLKDAFSLAFNTWNKRDGIPIIHYSSQKIGGKMGNHAETLDFNHFLNFIQKTREFDFDVMLEIKNKEKSAIKAITILKEDPRFFGG